MYLTNEKKLNYSLNGSYYTRKWNDYYPYVYFEKIYGGRGLLKKASKISEDNNITFHSSMVEENQVDSWESAGWFSYKKLYVCHQNLKHYSKKIVKDTTSITQKKLEIDDFSHLLDLDKKIFEPYWRNSSNSFHETLKSCVNNYLFIQKKQEELIGYAILGETRKYSYLQRIGVDRLHQGEGFGEDLLQFVLAFGNKKKFLSMKLNTQERNESAMNLYKKNGFRVQENKLVIMSTTKHLQV